MKKIDEIREHLVDNMFMIWHITSYMETEFGYYPVDEENLPNEDGILQYTNGKSEVWIKGEFDDTYVDLWLTSEVTMKTKQKGPTEVEPIRNGSDIKALMDYFRENEEYENFTIFMLDMLLARRIGDTLSLKWSDLYYENGARKDTLNTLVEQKTDKIIDITITDIVWKYLDYYCEKMNINPMDCLDKDVFQTDKKEQATTESEYMKAIKSQAAAFRYRFKLAADACGIKNVSTHSLRKTFGYITHELNKYDPDCLDVLQTVFGHDSRETTKAYIGIMREKARGYYKDVSNRIEEIDKGIVSDIDNIPVIALKTNDLRFLLMEAIHLGKTDFTDGEILNTLLTEAEKRRLA